MACSATLAQVHEEAVGLVKKQVIGIVPAVHREQQMDRQARKTCWILWMLHEFTGIMARECDTVLIIGGPSIESGKHRYNSQRGLSRYHHCSEETFLTFWRGALANGQGHFIICFCGRSFGALWIRKTHGK